MGIGFAKGAKIVLENCTIAGNKLFALGVVDAAKEPAMPENIASSRAEDGMLEHIASGTAEDGRPDAIP